MRHTLIKGHPWEKWVPLANTSHTWKNGLHFEKKKKGIMANLKNRLQRFTLEKCGTLGKNGHIRKNEALEQYAHLEKCAKK